MSTQRGNVSRTRPQKYRNKTKFRNDLHDTSHIIKNINKLEIVNICSRCKSIIEWKIKYKKYKQLKNPATCVSCHNKSVRHAYHTLCTDCATKRKICPKCGEEKDLVLSKSNDIEKELLQSPQDQTLTQGPSIKNNKTYGLPYKTKENDSGSEKKIVNSLNTLQLNSSGSNSSFETDESNDELSI